MNANYVFLIIIIVFVLICYFILGKLRRRKHKKKVLKYSIEKIDTLTGVEFENLLKLYFEKLGYKFKTTKVTSDYGADLVLTRNNRTTVVQAKRYKNKVSIKAVQEVVASKAVYNADSAIVVTNSYYTKSAWDLAKANHVYLIDRKKLIEIQKEINNKQRKDNDIR